MIACVHYSVYRGNSLENAEWVAEELRSLPKRVRPVAQDYEPDCSAGWLLMSDLEQAVWLVQEYGSGRTSYLSPRAVAVSPAAELPRNLERLLAWMEDLAFARTVLGARQDDPYYLVYPEGCLEGAVNVRCSPGMQVEVTHGCFRRRGRRAGMRRTGLGSAFYSPRGFREPRRRACACSRTRGTWRR